MSIDHKSLRPRGQRRAIKHNREVTKMRTRTLLLAVPAAHPAKNAIRRQAYTLAFDRLHQVGIDDDIAREIANEAATQAVRLIGKIGKRNVSTL